LSFAALCAATSVAIAQTDDQFRAKLVGEWKETRYVDCEEHRQRMLLRSNGTFEVAGFIGACNALSSFVWRGTWKVVASKFIYTTTYSQPPELYAKGVSFEDQILKVDDESWEMLEQSTGNKSIAFRLK